MPERRLLDCHWWSRAGPLLELVLKRESKHVATKVAYSLIYDLNGEPLLVAASLLKEFPALCAVTWSLRSMPIPTVMAVVGGKIGAVGRTGHHGW